MEKKSVDLPIRKYVPRRYIGICLVLVIVNLSLFMILRNPQSRPDSSDAEMVTVTLSPEAEADYHRMINISFNFLHVPKVCDDLESKFIVAVHTAPENFERRKAVRETWGSWYNKTKVLFVIGATQDEQLNRTLQLEINEHQDFLQGDFRDSYYNLTYKHTMVLKYMVYHCSNAKYLLKVDDDALVNMPNFVDFIEQYDRKYSNTSDIICNCWNGMPVLRNGTWGVSRDEYPYETYPQYCSGYSIIYTAQAAKTLYYGAQNSSYFRIDDAAITGIIAQSTGTKHVCTQSLSLSESLQKDILSKKFVGKLEPFIFAFFNISPEDVRKLWRYILKHLPKTSILDYIKNN